MMDLHIHTSASHDASGSVEDYCRAAIEMGFKYIGITNHLDLDPALPHANSYRHEDVVADIAKLRDELKGKLDILIGLEVTYQLEHEDIIGAAIENLDVDFIIGSIHMVGGADYIISEEEGAQNYFRGKASFAEACAQYFEEALNAVRFGWFDVIGHLDIIKRFHNSEGDAFRVGDHYGVLRRIFEGMIKRETALELNSSGLFHGAKDFYPSPEILALYRELGGRLVTLGSDAHEPANFGRAIERGINLLKSLNFNEATVFERRSPRQAALP